MNGLRHGKPGGQEHNDDAPGPCLYWIGCMPDRRESSTKVWILVPTWLHEEVEKEAVIARQQKNIKQSSLDGNTNGRTLPRSGFL